MAVPAKKTTAYWLPETPVRQSHALTELQINALYEPAGELKNNNSAAPENLLVSNHLNVSVKYYAFGTWVRKPDFLFKNFGRVPFGSSVKTRVPKGKLYLASSICTSKPHDSSAELPKNTFSQDLLQAQEQERQSLANELHDTLGQSVILMKNHILKLKNNIPETTETTTHLNTLADMVTDTLQKIREISYGLRPYELNLFGLMHAIRSLAEDVAEAAHWRLTLELPTISNVFRKEHEIHVYRVLQQCLEVVEKQAAATAVQIAAYSNPQVIEWSMQVTGQASFGQFLKNSINTDFNLLRLQEQLKIVSGRIWFIAAAPQITTIHLSIPIQQSPETHEKA